jgi:hypothetical protein
MAIQDPEALGSRTGAIRGDDQSGTNFFSPGSYRAVAGFMRSLSSVGRRDCPHAASKHRSNFSAFAFLCSDVWRLGIGELGSLGTAPRESPGVHSYVVYLSGDSLGPVLPTLESRGVRAVVSEPTGAAAARFVRHTMVGYADSLDLSHRARYLGLFALPLGAYPGAAFLTMEALADKFNQILRWERRKRREHTVAVVGCITLALAIIFLPLNVFLPNQWLRWTVPGIFSLVLAPWFFYRAKWRHQNSTRAVAALDKELRLAECAVTAWEIAGSGEPEGMKLLVLHKAEATLRNIEPRQILPRSVSWPMYGVLPLLLLWLALLWLDFDRPYPEARHLSPRNLAERVREYSRELQDKAKGEGLRETLKFGHELEKTAQKGIAQKTPDDSLRKEVSGLAQKFTIPAGAREDNNSFPSGETEQTLKDLKTELEASRGLQFPDGAKNSDEANQRWMERLSGLPQLKRQFDGANPGSGMGASELKAFLDKLDQRVTSELDRRALIDAQQYLEQMTKQGSSERGESYARSDASGEPDPSATGVREKSFSKLPGKEPGQQEADVRSLPDFGSGPQTQVKGILGSGESSGLMLKGNPTAGKSAVADQDVVTSYRRQAEQELNSERVPEDLKEMIKNYFLSLGEVKTK